MFNRHEHQWVEVRRNFNSPSNYKSFKQGRASDDLVLKMIYGVTNIELNCETCGDVRFKATIGQV